MWIAFVAYMLGFWVFVQHVIIRQTTDSHLFNTNNNGDPCGVGVGSDFLRWLPDPRF